MWRNLFGPVPRLSDMNTPLNRRTFIKKATVSAGAVGLLNQLSFAAPRTAHAGSCFQPNLRFMRKFQMLTSTIAMKLARYRLTCSQYT